MGTANLMDLLPGRLVLVGGGKMGAALAHGWLTGGLDPSRMVIVEPDAGRRHVLLAEGMKGQIVASVEEIAADPAPGALVLAVKPQVVASAVPPCRRLVGEGTLVVSVVAGTLIAKLGELLERPTGIVRVMPNTPAAIGEGAAVLCAGPGVSAAGRELAETLMRTSSTCHWIEDEAAMHAVTALSGSGPAYVFLLIETMAAAGERLGLAPELAQALAMQTVAGAGALARQSSESPAILRQNVTSPNGTTQAALDVLMRDPGLAELLASALAAAADRSRELAAG